MSERVDHPRHYNGHPSGVECIEIVESMPFCLGNAVKYLWRASLKGVEVEDLQKARWYLRHEVERGAYTPPSPIHYEKLQRVLAHEPKGNVLGDVLRYLTNGWPDVKAALRRVEAEIA